MPSPAHTLINLPQIEVIPAALLLGRGNRTVRALASAQWVVRRKTDGRYLAMLQKGRCHALQPHALRQALMGMTTQGLWQHVQQRTRQRETVLPLTAWRQWARAIDLPSDYGQQHQLHLIPEPSRLTLAGHDRYQRPFWLTEAAGKAWQAMQSAAAVEGVVLEVISGYRSHAYQWGIFKRKMAHGQRFEDILRVNAAPGYSEHHSGRALDIGTPGEPPAEESFELTAAFAWLCQNAKRFGFSMSYPRDNPHGIVYEPWHWCWQA